MSELSDERLQWLEEQRKLTQRPVVLRPVKLGPTPSEILDGQAAARERKAARAERKKSMTDFKKYLKRRRARRSSR